ncbi:MAG TPA: aminodeoxychorismate/anthranilate synthase component II [Bacteroidia bacterium]|nr:aminodeoxychorismate/anthranilate synthase component II [Bacteroidia bacterium]
MKVLVFDNYDSFTFNLVHLVEKITGEKPDVFRNDELEIAAAEKYDKIILSPGPGIPAEAGLLLPLIKTYAPTKSMFGVCLGQQAIAEAFGAQLYNLENVFHGVATTIVTEKDPGFLFRNIPQRFQAGRYHSWVVNEKTLPAELVVTARDEEGRIMALQHRLFNVAGVQFHPESIMTEFGEELMKNFLQQ